jgi:hypothetical protein
MTTLTDNATTIEIKGAKYAVEPIPAGAFGKAAARLTKLVSGESYDVLRTHDDRYECSCPDFEARHRGQPTQGCKHIKALRSAGFFTTPADVKRARAFGLTIPAPAKVEVPVVEQVIKAEEQVTVQPDDDALDPSGESWETWPESLDRYDLGPDAEPIAPARSDIDLTGFASKTLFVDEVAPIEPTPIEPFEDHRRGEKVALLITQSAIESGDDGAYFRLDHDDRESFWGFVGSLDWPAATWRGWLALCRSGSPVSFPEPVEAPKPTWKPRFVPTSAEMAEAAAMFRDNGVGGGIVVRRKVARPMVGHPAVDIQDVPHSELCEAGYFVAPRYAY